MPKLTEEELAAVTKASRQSPGMPPQKLALWLTTHPETQLGQMLISLSEEEIYQALLTSGRHAYSKTG